MRLATKIIIIIIVIAVVEVIYLAGNKTTEKKTLVPENPEAVPDCNGDLSCFGQHFQDCTAATVTTPLSENIIYYYEILGKQDSFCRVKSKFITHTNPEWVGKEMICDYNNSLSLGDAVEDGSRCQGPLVDLANGK